MRKTKYHLGVLTGTLLGVFVLAVTPVAAQHGSDSTASGSDDSTSSSTEMHVISTSSGSHEQETEAIHTQGADDSGSGTVKQQASDLLTEKRQKGKQKSTEARQKACTARAANINKRSKNYALSAQKHLDTFNGIFTKVQAFHDSKQLNVTDYDTLVEAAQAKQATAQAAVDTLGSLDVSIDCTSTDPASTVAALKVAVANARAALQDYRKSIKDVIVALKGASTADKTTDATGNAADDTTSTGGNQ